MTLRPLLATFSYALHREATRARLCVVAIFVCALVLNGIYYEGFAWHDFLSVLFPVGALWALWSAASLVPARREERVYAWESQGNTRPALLVLASWFGSSALAWLLLALSMLGAVAGDYDISVLQVMLWTLLIALAVIALALWREAEEPRAERPFRPRALVSVLAILLTAVLVTWLDDSEIPGATSRELERFGWFFWSLFPHQVSLVLVLGWLVCALAGIHRAAELAVCRQTRGLPLTFACSLLWLWFVIMGFSADGEDRTTQWAFLLTAPLALVAVLLQPETRNRPLHAEPVFASALFIVFAGLVASLDLAINPPASQGLPEGLIPGAAGWSLALALYLAAHVVLFVVARARFAGERRVNALWLALMITVWVVFLPLAAYLRWHYLAVAWLAPPLFHLFRDETLAVPPVLVFGALQLLAASLLAWHTRNRETPPIASISRRAVP